MKKALVNHISYPSSETAVVFFGLLDFGAIDKESDRDIHPGEKRCVGRN